MGMGTQFDGLPWKDVCAFRLSGGVGMIVVDQVQHSPQPLREHDNGYVAVRSLLLILDLTNK